MCSHYTPFSRLQNCVNRLRRELRERKDTTRRKGARIMNRLVKGAYVCCVWEKNLKPFAVKMVQITGIKGSGISGGLSEVVLENGISFRGSEVKSRHLYQDKARLAGALEAPTRANVLIFSDGYEAEKYLKDRGYLCLTEGVKFYLTDRGTSLNDPVGPQGEPGVPPTA